MSDKIETGYELLVIKGEDRGRVFPLQYREMHIGRKSHPAAADVDWIFLMDATVSRHHASVTWDDKRHKFILHHRSRTNPTLVNGQSVQQVDLEQDDLVQLGMLTFKVNFKLKRSMVEAHAQMLTTPMNQAESRTDTGFILSVIEGPDRGATFKLDQPVMIIGRRHGSEDMRTGQAVLLTDPTLPYEQVLLTWQERERTYGIVQMERSSIPTVVYRFGEDGTEQVVLDTDNQIFLQAEDNIRMGHTTVQLHSRQALRESAERGGRPTVDVGRMAPMEGMMGPILPAAPHESPPPIHVAPVSMSPPEGRANPPRLPAPPPPSNPDTPPSGERVPPRFGPPLGTRRTEHVIDNTALRGLGLPAAPPAPPTAPAKAPSPTEMLNNRSWPRLSGESAAAAQGMGDDPYPATYTGWLPPPIEHSGGPSPWQAAPPSPAPHNWVSDSGSRRGAGFQTAARIPEFGAAAAPMPTPGWAEPSTPSGGAPEPEQEHEFQDSTASPESAFDEPEPPAPVLRRSAPGLWSRSQGRPRTTDPLPSVLPVKRSEPEDVPPEPPPPRQVVKREPVEEPKPPARPREPAPPVFEAEFEAPEPARVRKAPPEPEPSPQEPPEDDWTEAPRQASEWSDSAARPASALPWAKTSAARRQSAAAPERAPAPPPRPKSEPPEMTARSRTFLGLSNDAARAAATRIPRIIGEPVKPPAAPAKKDLLGADFGARVVKPPRHEEDEEDGGSWSGSSTQEPRPSPIVKKPGPTSRPTAGGARPTASSGPEPRPINIIGLGGPPRPTGPARPSSPVRNAAPVEDEEDLDSLTSAGGWRFQADFVLGFLEGPNRGHKVELLTDELADGQEITLGKRGARTNDIELDDPQVANEQAVLRFHDNHFALTNQSRSRQIQVDKLVLGQDEEMLLKHGDRISIGSSKFIFLERSTVEALFGYELAILTGLPQDHGRRFDIIKERTSIGRGPDVDVSPHDEAVSRKHAIIQFRDGDFYLMHESVSTPTFVNGVSLPKGRERKLAVGDKIQISKATTLVFREKT